MLVCWYVTVQPCDGKVPFTLPWFDAVERSLAALVGYTPAAARDDGEPLQFQPYLCALCVDEAYRGQSVGRLMVRCVEQIVTANWGGYDTLHLHVERDNQPAMKLYKSEGYQEVKGIRWDPFWADGTKKIGYFSKRLK